MTLVASNRPYLKPGSSKPGRCQSTTPLKHAPVHLPVPLDQWISDWTELFRFLFWEKRIGLAGSVTQLAECLPSVPVAWGCAPSTP